MNELAQLVDDYIYHNRIKKVDIANTLGISRQRINQILNKKQFSVSDANYLLSAIDKQITFNIVDKQSMPITKE